jgi:hypothetical protein
MHRDTEHVHATFCGGRKVASVLYVRRLNEASAIASGVDRLISIVDEPEQLRLCSY